MHSLLPLIDNYLTNNHLTLKYLNIEREYGLFEIAICVKDTHNHEVYNNRYISETELQHAFDPTLYLALELDIFFVQIMTKLAEMSVPPPPL